MKKGNLEIEKKNLGENFFGLNFLSKFLQTKNFPFKLNIQSVERKLESGRIEL